MSIVTQTSNIRFIDPELIQRFLKITDFTVLFSISVVLFILSSAVLDDFTLYICGLLAMATALMTLYTWRSLRLYQVPHWQMPFKAILMSLLSAMIVGLAFYGLGHRMMLQLDLTLMPYWLAAIAGYTLFSRGVLSFWVHPRAADGAFCKRVAIVGGGKAAEDAINLLESSNNSDIEIIGLFDDRNDDRSPDSINRYAKIGKISDIADFSRQHRIDLIIVAIPLSAEARLLQMLKRLWELPVDIRISGESSTLKLSPRAYTYLGKLPLLSVFDRPLSAWGELSKAAMDRVFSAVLIVLLAPFMLAAALAVRLESKGPALFKQKRYGFNNELIEIYKFRSMYTDRCDASASKLVTKDDPRVTKVGRFIRKTSIDELPQLFNVLAGKLSLVGPRPHATQAKAAEELYEQVVDGYFARHKVKPGITGWAQINGWRGETDTHDKIENRVKYDLDYIDHWSLLFDLKILLKTPIALLRPGNAANAY